MQIELESKFGNKDCPQDKRLNHKMINVELGV